MYNDLGSNRGSRGGATNTGVNNIYQNVKPNELIGTSSKVFVFPNLVMPKWWLSTKKDLGKIKYRLSMKIKEILKLIYIFNYMLEPNRNFSKKLPKSFY